MEAKKLVGVRDEVDYSSLLFSRRDVAAYDSPFFHGCIDNYLPEQVYQSLLQNFPDKTLHVNYSAENTLGSGHPRLMDFWRASPFCKNLLSFFTSAAFLHDLKNFVTPVLRRERGCTDQSEWYYINNWSGVTADRERKPLRVTFKFSRLTSREWIPPHTDNPCKLFSFVLYFAESDWRESYGGGTEIYESKIAALKNNWRNLEIPFEFMRRPRTFAFLPNRLVFLMKSSNSWHGVSPLACPEKGSRKSLLVTFHDSPYQPENRMHTTARSLIRTWMQLKGYPATRA
jgi:hypothetical protein